MPSAYYNGRPYCISENPWQKRITLPTYKISITNKQTPLPNNKKQN